MNGTHCGSLVEIRPTGRIETSTVCFVNGETRRLWETPRTFLEEEIRENAERQPAYRVDDAEFRKELKRRDWIWAKYRMGAREG